LSSSIALLANWLRWDRMLDDLLNSMNKTDDALHQLQNWVLSQMRLCLACYQIRMDAISSFCGFVRLIYSGSIHTHCATLSWSSREAVLMQFHCFKIASRGLRRVLM